MGSIRILQQTKLHAAWVSWKDATHAKALARAKALQAVHLMQNVYIFRGLKASQPSSVCRVGGLNAVSGVMQTAGIRLDEFSSETCWNVGVEMRGIHNKL